jgi:hypothetical protein
MRRTFQFLLCLLCLAARAQTPIRIGPDSSVRIYSAGIVDSNTAQTVQFVRGDYVSFELGLFTQGNFLTSLGRFTNFSLGIWSAQNTATNPLMFQTLTSASNGFWNSAVTSNNWVSNGLGSLTTDTNYHLAFDFVPAQTAIPLNGQAQQGYWLRCYGVTTDAAPRTITFLEAPVTVWDGPISDTYLPPETNFSIWTDDLGNLVYPLNFFSQNHNALLEAIGADPLLANGTVTLVNGVATVFTWAANSAYAIIPTYQSYAGGGGSLWIDKITNGVSFNIQSSGPVDGNAVNYAVYEANPILTAEGATQILAAGVAPFVNGVATVFTSYAYTPSATNVLQYGYLANGPGASVTPGPVADNTSMTFYSSNPSDNTGSVGWVIINPFAVTTNGGGGGGGGGGSATNAVYQLNGLSNDVTLVTVNVSGPTFGISAPTVSGQNIILYQTNAPLPSNALTNDYAGDVTFAATPEFFINATGGGEIILGQTEPSYSSGSISYSSPDLTLGGWLMIDVNNGDTSLGSSFQANSFIGPLTGNVTGNLTGDLAAGDATLGNFAVENPGGNTVTLTLAGLASGGQSQTLESTPAGLIVTAGAASVAVESSGFFFSSAPVTANLANATNLPLAGLANNTAYAVAQFSSTGAPVASTTLSGVQLNGVTATVTNVTPFLHTNFGACAFDVYYTNVWNQRVLVDVAAALTVSASAVASARIFVFDPNQAYVSAPLYLQEPVGTGSEPPVTNSRSFWLAPGGYFAATNDTPGCTFVTNQVTGIP